MAELLAFAAYHAPELFALAIIVSSPLADRLKVPQAPQLDAYATRILGYLDRPEEITNRIHAQMIADGLFRSPQAHDRLGDA